MNERDEAILATYDLGKIQSVTLLPPPRYNKYEVVADSGRYFLCKRGRLWANEPMGRFAFFHKLVLFLGERGFPTPRLVENVDGVTYHPIGERVFELWAWVDGVNFADRPRGAQELVEMARLLARYHQTVETFEPTAPYVELPLETEIARNLETIAHRPVPAFILACTEHILNDYAGRFATLPKTAIHGDVWQGNFLHDSRRWWLLDYEWSRIDVRLYDLGNGLHCIPSIDGKAISISDFELTLGTYLAEVSLTESELECLPAMMQAVLLNGRIRTLTNIDRQLPDRQWAEQAEVALDKENDAALLKSIMAHEQGLHAAIERAHFAATEGFS